MNYSNKLNLPLFFYKIPVEEYVIVKKDDHFPYYYPYTDVDIFTADIQTFSREVLGAGKQFIRKNTCFQVEELSSSHTHLDFLYDGQIDFRFDLYGSMPPYQNINIKEQYFYSVIDRNKKIAINSDNGQKVSIFVPDVIDDLLIRYFEYLEYYEERKEKIKHLDYLHNKLMKMDDRKREQFFNRLHMYTDLPNKETGLGNLYFINKYFSSLKFYYSKVKRAGLKGIVKKVWK